jgi:hypothetical protein
VEKVRMMIRFTDSKASAFRFVLKGVYIYFKDS